MAGYDQFVGNIPFYGFAVLCIDHPAVQQMIPRLADRRIITYGFSPAGRCARRARWWPTRMGATFEVAVDRPAAQPRAPHGAVPAAHARPAQRAERAGGDRRRHRDGDRRRRRCAAPSPASAASSAASPSTGEAGGITVIDDYGHHPVEIAAVLKAARQAGARDVIAVVQPHRYTRLHRCSSDFCTCMNDAGTVIVADVYPAGEHADRRRQPRRAGRWAARARPSQRGAAARARASGRDGARHRASRAISSSASAPATSRNWAQALPAQLAALQARRAGATAQGARA